MSVRVPVGCPRCRSTSVWVWRREWAEPRAPGGVRRTAWADEPLRCERGCLLASADVAAALRAAYDGAPAQLALWPAPPGRELAG